MKPKTLKTIWSPLRMAVVLALVQMMASRVAYGQLPDCTTGNVMYAIFNDSTGSSAAVNSQIRSVNYTTGAVGPLMGGTSFQIRRQHHSNGDWYYGSSGLGVDVITNRFYMVTQMSGSTPTEKDILTRNTLTNTTVRIATTPTSLRDYHFVKLAISPLGVGYMIGVHRSNSAPAATFNPVVRFNTCGGTPTAGCATASVVVLGYLPDVPASTRWELFNGDIAFDQQGNMYYASAAYRFINGGWRYSDARLFRIDVSDIPTSAGTGVIPMTLLADYNSLDSTVVNGVAVNPAGDMFFTTRTFSGITNPNPPFRNRLYRSDFIGTTSEVTTFGPVPLGMAPADLASCYFPLTILPDVKFELSGKRRDGVTDLKWTVNNNNKGVRLFEVQRSNDFNGQYKTIGTVSPANTDVDKQTYTFADTEQELSKRWYYRVREVLYDGKSLYSNVVVINNSNFIQLQSRPTPNPFTNKVDFAVKMSMTGTVEVQMFDMSGRTVLKRLFPASRGDNKFSITDVGSLKSGTYVMEIRFQGEVLREKLVKQ
jgi:hypothetical protein